MRALALITAFLFATLAVAQEIHVGTDASVRTIFSFKAADAAVQKLIPPGWQVDAPASGPEAGANLRVTFIDGTWSQDAQGKPQSVAGRTITMGIPVKMQGAGTRGVLLFGGFTSGAAPGAYGVYARSGVTSQRLIRNGGDGVTTVEESWDAKSDTGDTLQFQLHYARGIAATEKIDVRMYSAAKPAFYRIYRYTQAVDMLRAAGTASERLKSVTFKAAGPGLASLFDGSEQLIGIASIPYFSRQVFLPGT